jgi:hypothetical protein
MNFFDNFYNAKNLKAKVITIFFEITFVLFSQALVQLSKLLNFVNIFKAFYKPSEDYGQLDFEFKGNKFDLSLFVNIGIFREKNKKKYAEECLQRERRR